MRPITIEQLKTAQSNQSNFLLVNTLDPEQFEKTKIADSVNIPQSQENFTERVAEVASSKEKPVVVYCASKQCDSSTQAAQKLDKAGFKDVYDFEGGAKAWQEAGEPIGA